MKTNIPRPGVVPGLSMLLAIPFLAVALSARAQCPPRGTEGFDGVTPPALPAGWVASQGVNVTGAPPWVTTNVASHTWPNDAFSTAPDNILDNRLDTPLFSADPFGFAVSFQNNYNLESGRDGAVLEISSPNINGGVFTDITDPAVGGSVSPGYNSVISSAFQSPIAGRTAWSGNSGGYVATTAFLGNAAFPPSQVKLRFRLASDNSGASGGWRIDSLTFLSNECPSPTPSPPPCPVQPWTFVANYPVPVIEQSAVWSNGTFAYSAGGYTSTAETNAFYRYDPASNSWTALAPLPANLSSARGVYVPSTNSFYVFGGLTQSQTTVLNTTYIYNVSTNTWTTGAPMPAARYFPNVAYYGGKIFVIGGHTGIAEASQTWEYDPVANTWNTARADIPVAMGGSATGVLEHFIYLIGHLNGGAGSTLHYRYDISLNTWALMAPAPAIVYEPVGATVDRQVHVVGGPVQAQHTGTYRYNTDNNTWTTGPETNVTHSYAGGTAIGNRLLIVGGYEFGSADTNLVEMAIVSCAPIPSPTPTPTPTPTPSPSPSPPPTPTPSATPTPTPTIFPTVTPTPSDCPGGECTPSPTASPPATATPSPSPTAPPSPPPTPSPTATPSPTPAQALNISTRLRVETGASVAIGGFIVTGNAPKMVAVRGLGPSLGGSGLSDVLADPTLELRGSDGALLLQNDNWPDDPAQAAQLTALGLAPQNPNESGMVATLEPGAYTALVAGKNQTSGLALVEIYDVDSAADSQLANISTRGFVRTADDVMIGGFILGQSGGDVDVAVRGLGPSLSQSGLTDVLADPTLELHDGNGALLIANDNWQDDSVSAWQLTAHGLAPTNDLESGIFIALPPGLFTAILAGKNGGVGLGLVEIYSGLHASTLTVTNTADSGPGSLRQALADANSGDTIQFDAALKDQTINLTSGELVIDKSITIEGFSLNHVIVQRTLGGPPFRIFDVRPGRTVTIEGLTITGGGGFFFFSVGGGVSNENATLTLSHCAVADNDSGGGAGGGIFSGGASARLTIVNSSVSGNEVFGESQGGFGQGGGISSDGMLTITNSIVSGNYVSTLAPDPGSAGGIFSGGTAEISNSTIQGNTGGAHGGGIVNGGSMTITNSTISGNTTVASGGGIENAGPLTITNSTISGNSAGNQGFGSCINLSGGTLQIQNTILHGDGTAGNISSSSGTVISHGYNLSSDDGAGLLTGPADQINTDPMLGPLQDNGGPTFTHELLNGSPAINAGDPSFTPPPLYDQRGPGYDRVVGGRIDVGSFEVPAGLALRLRH